MANYSDEYYKVSFITTRSKNIPKLLQHTGGLIVMSETEDDGSKRKSLWFRGDLIASGYGFSNEELRYNSEVIAGNFNEIIWGNNYAPYVDGSYCEYGINSFLPSYMGAYHDMGAYDTASVLGRITYVNRTNGAIISYAAEAYQFAQYTYASSYSWYNDNKDSIEKLKEDTSTYLNSYLAYAYTYTRNWIERIIGGAPDIVDSLADISYWLQNAQRNGLDTASELMRYESEALTHDSPTTYTSPEDENGVSYPYTYMSTYSSYVGFDYDHPKTGEEKHNVNYKVNNAGEKIYEYIFNYTNGLITSYTKNPLYDDISSVVQQELASFAYTYYDKTSYIIGLNAIRDYQVSTSFEGHTLQDILDCMVDHYDYKKPSVDISKINDVDVEEFENYVEIGTTNDFKLEMSIDKNDAESASITGIISDDYANLEYDINGNVISTSVEIDSEMDLVVTDKCQVIHGDAVPQPYPQFKDLDPVVYDEDGLFKANDADPIRVELEHPFTLKGRYKIFYNEGNDDYPFPTKIDVSVDNSQFITDTYITGIKFSGTSDKVWIAYPVVKNVDKIWLTDTKTNISQELTTSTKESDVLEVTTKEVGYDVTTTKYFMVCVENKEFLMGSDYTIEIELS